jgi:A/G-specific adenine glycosylase
VTTSGPERVAPPSAALRRRVSQLPVIRSFPWRETRDPWRILVAELCCQQTQASRAVAVYQRCCEWFPTPAACAAAPLREVLEAWRGLGYYRRARALHAAATAIVDVHAGVVPDDLDALLALPGVGPYTARAVLCFAFERDVGIVDTNVARVLARAIAGRPLTSREAQALADDLVPAGRGWAHNQAMLDLGATTCAPVARCDRCPLRPCCRWRRAGAALADPAGRTAHAARTQPRFAGSDREGRGRLLAAALDAPLRRSDIAAAAGWPNAPARAARVADGLVADGLLEVVDGTWRPRR